MKIQRIILGLLTAVLFTLFTGLLMNGIITPVKAATTSEEQPVTTDAAKLQEEQTQSDQVQALGLSADQPSRIAPSGKEVDKSKNPLGPNRLTLNRVYQLNTIGAFTSGSLNNSLVGMSAFTPGGIMSPLPDLAWNNAQKVVVAADVDGNGKQEVITAGLLPDRSEFVKLQLYVTDYSDVEAVVGASREPAVSNVYTIAFNMTKPSDDPMTDSSLKAVTGDFDHDGKDEVAIAVGERLYLCKVDMKMKEFLSARTFSAGIGDIEAVDADKDGFPDLLVTEDEAIRQQPAKLYIYSGTDLEAPRAEIPLVDSFRRFGFSSASVDVGDLFGDGEKEIVIGGPCPGPGLSYVKYHPETESFDTAVTSVYRLWTETDFTAVKSRLDVQCVSLNTPVPGEPQYVVLGGFIFQYNQTTDVFERKDVTTATNNSKDVRGNNSKTSEGSITNVNYNKNSTYILQTLVGNFDGNTKGKEQIIMLHYNKWYDSDYVYVTWCGMDSSGDISANLREIWNKGNDYCYPAICATDIYNQGITLEFEPSKSKFMYSNPTVISVLGASPFYKELEDKQANLSNVGTTYGSETENSNSVSNGLTAEVGVSFGFSQSIGVFGIEFGSMGFETQITNSFSASWTKAKSISKGISFTNLYMEDAVVLMVIPSDVYYYKVYANNNGTIVESEMVMNVPYSPVTTIMPLEDYNQVAATIENAPVIGPEVLKHTVGNPRSYPQRSQGLSNIEGNDVLLAGNDENESFIGSGTGNSVVQQSITTSSTSEKSFDYALSIDVSYNVSIFGVSSGISAGAGYTRNVTISSSESTIRAGSVASVPVENSGYSFMWALAAYNYDLSAGDSTQECTVISYLVKPIGSFPPLVPSNLRVDSRTLLATTLKWDPAEGAAGYRIFRAPSLSDSFIEITDPLTGKDSTSYTDEDLTPNQNYSYIILAYSGRESIKTEPLKVKSLSIKDIRIKTQPKLTYDEEEPLDLSALIVRLKINDDSTQDISFADFSKYSITTNFGHGVAIKVTDSGIPITVKYKPVNMMVNTNVLTVNAKSPYDLTLSVTFEVGSTNNATELKPNKTLKARIELTNKQSSDHRVLLVLALFSDKGNMVQYTSFSRTIHAGITRELAPLTLELPNNVNGYTAKVFVWDGENFTTTTLTPKSESAQIPTR